MNSRKKILIVDDEQLNLEFFDVMLSKLGFIVEKAEDGVEALEQVKRFEPDVIMLDNIMPRMSGWEVTKTLKADPLYRDIPIIMFSALGDVKDKVEGFELGIDDYITKPFNFSEVLARIQAVLRNRELYGQILVRESRLNLAEAFTSAIKPYIADFLKSIDDLDAACAGIAPGAGAEALPGLVARIREKTLGARKNITELSATIDKTISEWEDLKKNEIEVQALEKQFRKGPQQKQGI
ncbi:MAG: response regulator [Spirochaetaceae bacterium]|jgi:CheY-like chemotaxis protein|nr:response regulator [Spirochaetaceae bacterium]